MTYDPKIPSITSSPSSSVTQIQTNFAQFAAVFSSTSGGVVYNHVALNDVNNQGKHAAVLMQNQIADPGVTQTLDVLYSKDAAAATGGPQAQLFVQIPKFLPTKQDTTPASNVPMQLTYNSVNIAGPQFQSFLAGGYIIYFGLVTGIAAITLVPTPTKILMAQAIPQSTSTFQGVLNVPNDASVTLTQPATVKINSVRGPGNKFLWMAIAQA